MKVMMNEEQLTALKEFASTKHVAYKVVGCDSSTQMIWKDGPVIAAMRRGAVLCLDEIDQARPAILALQTVAQNKPYFIKKTNELVRPRKGFTLIATANTKGTGDGMDKFSGAQILNEDSLSAFLLSSSRIIRPRP